jgi:hypothetical protein
MQYDAKPPRRRFNSTQQILAALVVIAVVMGGISAFEDGHFEWRGLAGNLATELLGAVITFIIIERIIDTRESQQQLRQQLIRDMGNPDNGIAAHAVSELRVNGWLSDGSLAGWFLSGANLQGVYLRDANLKGLGLYRSNLKDAKITEEQLIQLHDLRRTIMPDGCLYDGRFQLPGDLNWALEKFGIDVRTAAPEQMANYYEVSVDAYLKGQEWAKHHLH